MRRFGALVLVVAVGSTACDAAEIDTISKPTRGDRSLSIVRSKNDTADVFFVDTKTNERLGDVLGHLRGVRINSVEASWAPDGHKVAVLLSYGTRLNTILAYSLGNDHKMKSVKLPDIDPMAIYAKRYPGKQFLQQAEGAAGYSENAIGGWITNDTVKIVRGEAVVDPQDDARTKHFFVVAEIRMSGRRGQVLKLLPTGVLSNEQATKFPKFLKEWKH